MKQLFGRFFWWVIIIAAIFGCLVIINDMIRARNVIIEYEYGINAPRP